MLQKAALVLLVSFLMVSGQAALSIYSRSLSMPIRFPQVLIETLESIFFYCLAVSYSAGLLGYAYLLRQYPLAEINITLMVVMISMTLAYTYWLGQPMTGTQWLGAVVAAAGLIALQSRWGNHFWKVARNGDI